VRDIRGEQDKAAGHRLDLARAPRRLASLDAAEHERAEKAVAAARRLDVVDTAQPAAGVKVRDLVALGAADDGPCAEARACGAGAHEAIRGLRQSPHIGVHGVLEQDEELLDGGGIGAAQAACLQAGARRLAAQIDGERRIAGNLARQFGAEVRRSGVTGRNGRHRHEAVKRHDRARVAAAAGARQRHRLPVGRGGMAALPREMRVAQHDQLAIARAAEQGERVGFGELRRIARRRLPRRGRFLRPPQQHERPIAQTVRRRAAGIGGDRALDGIEGGLEPAAVDQRARQLEPQLGISWKAAQRILEAPAQLVERTGGAQRPEQRALAAKIARIERGGPARQLQPAFLGCRIALIDPPHPDEPALAERHELVPRHVREQIAHIALDGVARRIVVAGERLEQLRERARRLEPAPDVAADIVEPEIAPAVDVHHDDLVADLGGQHRGRAGDQRVAADRIVLLSRHRTPFAADGWAAAYRLAPSAHRMKRPM